MERYKLPYGAIVHFKDGGKVKAKDKIADWDPHTHPIINEVAGKIRFDNLVEGVSVTEQIDELTGSSTYLVMDPKQRRGVATDVKPTVELVDGRGKPKSLPGSESPARYPMPPGASVVVADGIDAGMGEVLARIPQEAAATRDITGGLPRVAELFEARKAKEPAILATHSGVVKFGKEVKTKVRLEIEDESGEIHEMGIPKSRLISVFAGEHVEQGDVVVEGPPTASDILELKGLIDLTDYIVNEVQDVYRLQGVKINDKHIEVIIRQMLRKAEIRLPGETRFLRGEQVDRARVLETNEEVEARGGEQATYVPVLLGITKASLSTDSFISAASFQETTRVLTEASMQGKVDRLRGLKENVIVGRLIPAGTGSVMNRFRQVALDRDQVIEEERKKQLEAEEAAREAAAEAASGTEKVEELPPADAAG